MTNEQLTFILKVADACRKYYPVYRILPSLTIAQTIKESNWGKSKLSSKYFNFHGLKWKEGCGCDFVTMPTKEYVNGKYIVVNAKFRAYKSFEEGIKGYYDFLSGYKRYHNLIGITDPVTACQLIQADGYATSPTYATSLYNDYILRYNLTQYDVMDSPVYIAGKVYTLQNDMYIRKEPNGDHKTFDEITDNARLNGYTDANGYAILKSGTRVTCLDVSSTGSSIWILIPSGWICGKSKTRTYVI